MFFYTRQLGAQYFCLLGLELLFGQHSLVFQCTKALKLGD
jgi:hypothetical protein